MTTENKPTFEEWCEQLKNLAASRGYTKPDLAAECGPDAWRDYYDDGETAEEALNDSESYGE